MASLDENPVWVANERDADVAAEFISNFRVIGYDSEFDGVQVGAESCVGKARVDVFSIATPVDASECINPIGFSPTSAFVFEGRLLNYGPIKSILEDSACTKCVHNLPVDAHAAANQGVGIRGGCNTLSMARWVYPERANLPQGKYDLDSLCRWRLGFGKVDDFRDLFGYERSVEYEVMVDKKECECGKIGCRKKTGVHGIKWPVQVPTTRAKMVFELSPLAQCRPNGSLSHKFDRYLRYAAADAELALMLYQVMQIDGRAERVYPWYLENTN